MVDILTLGRSKELSKSRAAHMELAVQQTVKTEPVKAILNARAPVRKSFEKKKATANACRWCGGPYPHVSDCPAKGHRCVSCGKYNHFAKVCRATTKPKEKARQGVNAVDFPGQPPESEDDMDDDENAVHVVYAIEPHSRHRRKAPKCDININGLNTTALIDTGASINLMATDILEQMRKRPTLTPTCVRVHAYGNNEPLHYP